LRFYIQSAETAMNSVTMETTPEQIVEVLVKIEKRADDILRSASELKSEAAKSAEVLRIVAEDRIAEAKAG
jgi:hypothetical protein